MATASATPAAFVELTPRTLHLAISSGGRIVALRAFPSDAKAAIAACVAEHQLGGSVRASLLANTPFIQLADGSDLAGERTPAALLAHAGAAPHGFDGTPCAVAVDAGTGTLPDATGTAPWLLAATDTKAIAAATRLLIELGLTPTSITLAAPAHVGAVAESLAPGETALVVLPGETGSHVIRVTAEGVQAVVTAPIGFSDIISAVQLGLGLKFKAAAAKLFYNEDYDFSEVAPKVAELLVNALRPALEGAPASYLHIAGLLPAQAWLIDRVAGALNLAAWTPPVSGGVAVQAANAGVVKLSAAGAGDAPWVQSPLEDAPSPEAPAATAPAEPPPEPVPEPVVVAPVAPRAAVAAAKPIAKPAPPAAAKPPKPPVAKVTTTPAATPEPKSKAILIIAGSSIGALVAGIGLSVFFSGRSDPPDPQEPAPIAATPGSMPRSAAVAAPTPAPLSQPLVPDDQLPAETRKFRNARYHVEVTDKGFIQAHASSSDEVLVESAAGISLQGSYVGTDGRRKWFNSGGVDDAHYQATVNKSVVNGLTVFDVKVTHPRFELSQSFTCQLDSIKVSARFTPINLRDPRGAITAVHSVRVSPMALNPSMRMQPSDDSFVFSTKPGLLRTSFDATIWARDGAGGRRTVVAAENSVAFHFTETPANASQELVYELRIP